MPELPSASEIALRLVRALIDEIKAAAHDPETVHAVAAKLHTGLDALEKAMTEPEKEEKEKP